MRTIEKRDVTVWIILTIVTCGIAGLVWVYNLTEDMNAISADSYTTSGGLVVLLALFCQIYMPFWGYKQGVRIDQWHNTPNGNRSILYAVVCLFIPVIIYAIIQDELNMRADAAMMGQ